MSMIDISQIYPMELAGRKIYCNLFLYLDDILSMCPADKAYPFRRKSYCPL